MFQGDPEQLGRLKELLSKKYLTVVTPLSDPAQHDGLTIINNYILINFNRRLLLTTLTELNAIAAPAIMGLRRNPFTG